MKVVELDGLDGDDTVGIGELRPRAAEGGLERGYGGSEGGERGLGGFDRGKLVE